MRAANGTRTTIATVPILAAVAASGAGATIDTGTEVGPPRPMAHDGFVRDDYDFVHAERSIRPDGSDDERRADDASRPLPARRAKQHHFHGHKLVAEDQDGSCSLRNSEQPGLQCAADGEHAEAARIRIRVCIQRAEYDDVVQPNRANDVYTRDGAMSRIS